MSACVLEPFDARVSDGDRRGDLEHGGADGSPLPGPLRLDLAFGQNVSPALVELDFEVGCAGLREPFGGGEFDLLRVLERSGAELRGALSARRLVSGVQRPTCDIGRGCSAAALELPVAQAQAFRPRPIARLCAC